MIYKTNYKKILLIIILFTITLQLFSQNFKKSNIYDLIVSSDHSTYVSNLKFSQDDNYLITFGADKSLKIWDSESRILLKTYSSEECYNAKKISFSSDGKFILAYCKDKSLKIWEINTWKIIKSYFDLKNDILDLCFSPDGNHIALYDTNGQIIIRNIKSDKIINQFQSSNKNNTVIFTPDGEYIFYGNNKRIIQRHIVTGSIIKEYSMHSAEINKITFSKNGKYFASSDCYKNIIIWDFYSGKPLHTYNYNPPEETVLYSGNQVICFSSDEKFFAFNDKDSYIKIVSTNTGELISEVKADSFLVVDLSFFPGKNYLLSAGIDGNLKEWDIDTGQNVRNISGIIENIDWSSAFKKDNKIQFLGKKNNQVKSWIFEIKDKNNFLSNMRSFEISDFKIIKIIVSPDGTLTAVSNEKNEIIILNTFTGKILHKFTAHKEIINDINFSPDSKYLISGSRDKTAKLWDAKSGRLLHTFTDSHGRVEKTIFTNNLENIITFNSDAAIQIWNLNSGELIKQMSMGIWTYNPYLSISGDDEYIAAAAHEYVRLVNIKTGNILIDYNYEDFNEKTIKLIFSSDGFYLLCLTNKNKIIIWDTKNYKLIKTINGQFYNILRMDLSSNQSYFITACEGGEIKFIDFNSGNITSTLAGFNTGNKENEWIIYTPENYFWGSKNLSNYIYFVKGLKKLNNNYLFNKYNKNKIVKKIPLFDYKEVQYKNSYEIENNQEKYPIEFIVQKENLPEITCAALSNNNLMASSDKNGMIKIWDLKTGKEIKKLKGHQKEVTSIKFSKDGKYLVSSSFDMTIKLWNVETGIEIKTYQGSEYVFEDVIFSPDEKYIISASYKEIIIWNKNKGKIIKKLNNEYIIEKDICISPDGKYIAAGYQHNFDNIIIIRDVKTYEIITTIAEDFNNIFTLSFTPDGKYLAGAGSDREVYLWDTTNWNRIRSLTKHDDYILNICFSEDGKYLFSSSKDATVKVWSMEENRLIYACKGHINDVESISISQGKNFFISGSRDGTIKYWDYYTGELRMTTVPYTFTDGTTGWLHYTPDFYFNTSENVMGQFYFVQNKKIIEINDEINKKYYKENLVSFVLEKKSEKIIEEKNIDPEKDEQVKKIELNKGALLDFTLYNGYSLGKIKFGMPIDIFTTLFPDDNFPDIFQVGTDYYVIFNENNTEIMLKFSYNKENNKTIFMNIEIVKINPDFMIQFNADFTNPDEETLEAFGHYDFSIQTEKYGNRKEDYYLYPDAINPRALIVVQYKRKGTWFENTSIYSEYDKKFKAHLKFREEYKNKEIIYEVYNDYISNYK